MTQETRRLTRFTGTAVVWTGARCVRRIDALTRRDLVLLAATAAVAFGARAATMLLAIAVVGVVALCRFTRPASSANARLHSAIRLAAVGLGPAVVLFGWFYARNAGCGHRPRHRPDHEPDMARAC